MLLNSIKLTNFRGFKGNHFINLKTNNDKNIITILGSNTFGKSTIIQSIKWCFYGKANFDKDTDGQIKIYNRGIEKDLDIGNETLSSVEISFKHENTNYTAFREVTYFKTNNYKMIERFVNFSITYVDNETGQTQKCGNTTSELNTTINSILPQELSSYFFFEGEKNNDLTTKELGLAIKNLLGIEALTNMKMHLYGNSKNISSNSVMGRFKSKISKNNNINIKKAWENRNDYLDEISLIDSRLEEIDNDINNYENKITEINNKLRKAEPTKLKQNRRDQIKRELNQNNKFLQVENKRYIDDFNNNIIDLFTIPLISKAKKRLNEMDLSDKGIIGLEVSAIEELLNRGCCLCGTDLQKGSLAYKKVAEFIDILPPKSVGQLVKNMIDNLSESKNRGTELIKRLNLSMENILEYRKSIDRLEREDKDILIEIKNMPNKNIKAYEKDLNLYKQRISNLRKEHETKIFSKADYKKKFEDAEKKYNNYLKDCDKNNEYLEYYNYTEEIYKWLCETYDEKEEEMRFRLQQLVSDLFNKIYIGNRKVLIDENYNIKVFPSADTGGLKIIKYFSYVGGLVKLAAQVLYERKENEFFGEEFPLVLDAAFSHADTTHTKSIAKELSKVSNQLIFAVMDKDWNNVTDELKDKTNKTYRLNKINEDEISIEEIIDDI